MSYYQSITDPDDIFPGCDAFTAEDPVALADLAYHSVSIQKNVFVVESHIVCMFANEQDADAFDAGHVYSGFQLFIDEKSWMSLAAAEELAALVDAQTPPSVSRGPCVAPGTWSLLPEKTFHRYTGHRAWQEEKASCEAARICTMASLAVACPFIRRFRLPAGVLFRYIGIGSPMYQRGHLRVALPRSMLSPTHMLHDYEYVMTREDLWRGLSPAIVPIPCARIVPIVQMSGSFVQVPLEGTEFVAAIVDCCDVTRAAIVDVGRMVYWPLHVHVTARHTVVTFREHLSWDVLAGAAANAHVKIPHNTCFVLRLQTEEKAAPRTVVFTMIDMNYLQSIDGVAGFKFGYCSDTIAENCSSVLYIRDDNDDRRLKVPSHLLRKHFDDAHDRYIKVKPTRLAWMSACARARPRHNA